jgi:hypothetical protein
MRSSVDFPQPLGPTSETISPGAIDRLAFVRAKTSLPSAATNRFERFSMRKLDASLGADEVVVAVAAAVTT